MENIRIIAQYRGKTIAEHSVTPHEGMQLCIGRGEGADISISNPYIARKHCVLLFSKGCWYAKNLGQNGSYVNGRPAAEFVPLGSHDKLSLLDGEKEIRIRFASGASVHKPPSMGTPSAPLRSMELFIMDGMDHVRQLYVDCTQDRTIPFGRSPDNGIVIESQAVSGHHGIFRMYKGRLMVQDVGSTNGLWINGAHYLKSHGPHILASGDIIKIDANKGDALSATIVVREAGGSWHCQPLDRNTHLLIGRGEDCDIRLSHVGVSRKHALIHYDGAKGGFVIENLGMNGTLVNGSILNGTILLKNRSSFQIANTSFYLCGNALYYNLKDQGLCLTARALTRDVVNNRRKKRILDNVELRIEPGEFVAIVGGSGCGKSTLLNALTGYEKATSGSVMVGDKSLYQNYDYFKSLIGFVPQQDIVYDHIQLQQMLEYTARLRMPKDTVAAERHKRVKDVLDMVELGDFSNSMVKKLSGGQRKRASIAVELLADPGLFFLDEPTSGLDPGTERNLMATLRRLSTENQKTVIMVTHTTLNLHMCDKIVFMGKGGKLCFCGAPDEALRFFGVDNLVDIYNIVAGDTDTWHRRFESLSASSKNNVEEPLAIGRTERPNIFRQTAVLSGRYFQLICNDRARLALMLLEPVIMGLILYVCKPAEAYETYIDTKNLLFTFVCCAIWIGIFNTVQEICKERAILKREYMANLSLTAYVSSKLAIQTLLCFVQSLLLFGVFAFTCGLPEEGILMESPIPEMFLTSFLTILSSSCMGLCLSSVVKNADRAMTLSPFLLVVQLVFAGIIFKLEGAVDTISNATISRWSISALGVSANLEKLYEDMGSAQKLLGGANTDADKALEMFEHVSSNLTNCWLILVGFCLAFCVLAVLLLRNISKDSR